jgi:hypothetical protein
LPKRFAVEVLAPDQQFISPGFSTIYEFVIKNTGAIVDTFEITATSSNGWAAVEDLPPPVGLLPGEETTIGISITVPMGSVFGSKDVLSLKAVSQSIPSLIDHAGVNTIAVRFGDFDGDGDVDGYDLSSFILIYRGDGLNEFALNYGSIE